MSNLDRRVSQLEAIAEGRKPRLPYVVALDVPADADQARFAADLKRLYPKAPTGWRPIVVPEPMTQAEWVRCVGAADAERAG